VFVFHGVGLGRAHCTVAVTGDKVRAAEVDMFDD
jgi:hypothetical protein